jgi:hypothetical protein
MHNSAAELFGSYAGSQFDTVNLSGHRAPVKRIIIRAAESAADQSREIPSVEISGHFWLNNFTGTVLEEQTMSVLYRHFYIPICELLEWIVVVRDYSL